MRHWRRWLFNSLAGLSLLLCGGFTVCWMGGETVSGSIPTPFHAPTLTIP